jgi:hypothetical protein
MEVWWVLRVLLTNERLRLGYQGQTNKQTNKHTNSAPGSKFQMPIHLIGHLTSTHLAKLRPHLQPDGNTQHRGPDRHAHARRLRRRPSLALLRNQGPARLSSSNLQSVRRGGLRGAINRRRHNTGRSGARRAAGPRGPGGRCAPGSCSPAGPVRCRACAAAPPGGPRR